MPYTLAALALAATLLLPGCGQMGPLYEPEQGTEPGKTALRSPQQPKAA